jgi:guanosine-3',5'-bis(diphosphate) 3'-pyrophosphohydrolase
VHPEGACAPANLQDVLATPPAGWSLARQQKYFDWAKEVVDQARGVNPRLERMFDRLYRQRPGRQ